MFREAENNIVSFLQSDMVIGKDYDIEVLRHLNKNTIICSTRIEPPLHPPSSEKLTANFGLTPLEFKKDEFDIFVKNNIDKVKITKYFFAPFTMYKNAWLDIGGHDTLFRRSREDTDILKRFILNGIDIIQAWSPLCYHFTCTSSRGADWFNQANSKAQNRLALQNNADRQELRKFIRKWGHFSHSIESVLPVYKVDAFVDVDKDDIDLLYNLEPYFNKLYVNSKNVVNELIARNEKEINQYANSLFNYSTDDWDMYKEYYNTQRLDKKIIYIDSHNDIKSDILFKCNITSLQSDQALHAISNICTILNTSLDKGEYELLNGIILNIEKVVDYSLDNICVATPDKKFKFKKEKI
jgi:hypothetical protein